MCKDHGKMGRLQRRKKGSRQYSVGTGQAVGRQIEEKKGDGRVESLRGAQQR